MLQRYACERCADCGRGLTWIEIAFGKFGDPVCGRCLQLRIAQHEREQDKLYSDIGTGMIEAFDEGAAP